jgi:hypothetical protein
MSARAAQVATSRVAWLGAARLGASCPGAHFGARWWRRSRETQSLSSASLIRPLLQVARRQPSSARRQGPGWRADDDEAQDGGLELGHGGTTASSSSRAVWQGWRSVPSTSSLRRRIRPSRGRSVRRCRSHPPPRREVPRTGGRAGWLGACNGGR